MDKLLLINIFITNMKMHPYHWQMTTEKHTYWTWINISNSGTNGSEKCWKIPERRLWENLFQQPVRFNVIYNGQLLWHWRPLFSLGLARTFLCASLCRLLFLLFANWVRRMLKSRINRSNANSDLFASYFRWRIGWLFCVRRNRVEKSRVLFPPVGRLNGITKYRAKPPYLIATTKSN